jgi:hypothetical protein
MKEYVVTFKTSVQISPDDWGVINPSMKVTEITTIKEIDEFYRKYNKVGSLEVKLVELEKTEK